MPRFRPTPLLFVVVTGLLALVTVFAAGTASDTAEAGSLSQESGPARRVVVDGVPRRPIGAVDLRQGAPRSPARTGAAAGDAPLQSVETAMGLDLDFDTGELLNPGTVYQYGHELLCNKVWWEDLAIGTKIRWQWYQNDVAIVSPQLNVTIEVEETSGFDGSCIEFIDLPSGVTFPIPIGAYKVDVWAVDVEEDDPTVASVVAVIQEDVPPGATAFPTAAPTATTGPTAVVTPTSTPIPTATFVPGTVACHDVIVNGDFERGPDVGWDLDSNVEIGGRPLNTSDVIVNNDDFPNDDPAYEGDWLALLGGDTSFEMDMQLFQKDALPLYPPTKVVSATLRYYLGIVSTERPDFSDDDVFGVYAVSQANEWQQVPGTGVSEETIEAGNWYLFEPDLTDFVKQRPGWTAMSVLFFSALDDSDPTYHLVDSVSLEVCHEVDGSETPVVPPTEATPDEPTPTPDVLGTVTAVLATVTAEARTPDPPTPESGHHVLLPSLWNRSVR